MKAQKKARIIKRTMPDGSIEYVVQQRHFLFRWWWVDAWVNSITGASYICSWDTLEKAQKHLCYFDGTKCSEEVVQ